MHIGFTGPISLAPLAGRLGCPPPVTYAVPYTGLLVGTWLDQGHRVTVYALGEVERPWVRTAGPLTVVVVPMRAHARHYLRDFFRVEREALVREMRARPADVVSAHWTYEFALAAARSGRPAFVTAHDAPLRCAWEEGLSPYRWLRNSLALPAVHRATALSGVSPYTARHLRTVLRAPGPVRVIPNGVRLTGMPSAPTPSATAAPVFATVLNGWGPLKNGRAALAAFGLARRSLPAARLLMFGDGFGAEGPAAAWAAGRGLAAGVDFVGPTGHGDLLGRLAAEATVLVHPSRLEACPMILLEAMAVGVPVLGGRRSGAVPWVLDEGRAGVLADVDSPRRLADAMVDLGRDTALRARLATAGRSRVHRHFDLDAVADTYTDWFGTAA
ncbi:glycosyltransferase family 4 protein [Streptomyces sp. NRRL B-24484]|uniref:glycosyltransferase family 4 protein n=1 Tax=Streptomyces sp. NRRL B-24484 TaxID=1463833 RepID=UPI0004C16E91|nr:glycosyltransferase family 4 protein [Streptomyces sp. NRRL B-24484]